jgi:hypothetical protein
MKTYPVASVSDLLMPGDGRDLAALEASATLLHQMKKALLPISLAVLNAVSTKYPKATEVERAQACGVELKNAMANTTANTCFLFSGTQPNTNEYHSKLSEFKAQVLLDSVSGFLTDFSDADKERAIKRAGDLFNVLTKTIDTCQTDSQGNYQTSCVIKSEDGELVGYYVAQTMKVTASVKTVTQGKSETKTVDTKMEAHTDTFQFLPASLATLKLSLTSMTDQEFAASEELVKVLVNNGVTM